MEVRSGLDGFRLIRLDQALSSLTLLGVDPAVDFHTGSELYRAVRKTGHTVRSMMDCLIAAVALRTGAVLVHAL